MNTETTQFTMVRPSFLRLTRVANMADQGTFGVLTLNGMPFCVTLEPNWAMNKKNVSCVPAGQYICKPYTSPKYGWTWQVHGVPGRSYILFHAGNTADHTEGCIITAQRFGKLFGKFAVLNSGQTFKTFIALTKNESKLHLTITENF